MKLSELKVKPEPWQDYAIGHDLLGSLFVAFRTRGHVDYIYGMFTGRELVGGHLDSIKSWHEEGEELIFTGHPKHGNIVLVMGIPVREIVGHEADARVNAVETGSALKEYAEGEN